MYRKNRYLYVQKALIEQSFEGMHIIFKISFNTLPGGVQTNRLDHNVPDDSFNIPE